MWRIESTHTHTNFFFKSSKQAEQRLAHHQVTGWEHLEYCLWHGKVFCWLQVEITTLQMVLSSAASQTLSTCTLSHCNNRTLLGCCIHTMSSQLFFCNPILMQVPNIDSYLYVPYIPNTYSGNKFFKMQTCLSFGMSRPQCTFLLTMLSCHKLHCHLQKGSD